MDIIDKRYNGNLEKRENLWRRWVLNKILIVLREGVEEEALVFLFIEY